MTLANNVSEFKYKLTNPLIISTINLQLTHFINLITKESKIQIDLSDVIDIDSSGIAFLLELKQQAAHKKCQLIFINKTDAIQRLADLYKITI